MPSLIPSLGSLPSAVADSYLIGSLLADESLHAISPSGDDWLLSKFALGDLDELIVDGIGALPGHYATLTAAVAACTGDEVIRIVADTTEPAGTLTIDVDLTILWNGNVNWSGKGDVLEVDGCAVNIYFGERGILSYTSGGFLSFNIINGGGVIAKDMRFNVVGTAQFQLSQDNGTLIVDGLYGDAVSIQPDNGGIACVTNVYVSHANLLAAGTSSPGVAVYKNVFSETSCAFNCLDDGIMFIYNANTHLGNLSFGGSSPNGTVYAHNSRFYSTSGSTLLLTDANSNTEFHNCHIINDGGTYALNSSSAKTVNLYGCVIEGAINNVTPNPGDFSNVWNGVTWGIAATNEQSGTTYTFAIDDQGKIVYSTNGSATTFTVPPNSSVAFPVGAMINVQQAGAGALTIAQGSGVTISSLNGNLQLAGQYAEATLRKTATDTWTLGMVSFTPRTQLALVPLATAIKNARQSFAIQVLGDSTGNDTTEWVYTLAQQIATEHPELTVKHRLWSDATQWYAAPTTIQTGTDGELYVSANGEVGMRSIPAAQASMTTNGVWDIRVKLYADDWTPAVASAIIGKEDATNNYCWYLQIPTGGTLQFVFSENGSTLTSVYSTALVSAVFSNGSTGWIRCLFDPDDGGGNRVTKFYTSTDGITWTQLGTTVTTATPVTLYTGAASFRIGGRLGTPATGFKIYEVYILDGENGEDGGTLAPVLPDLWTPQLSPQNVYGAPVLTVLNGSHPGATISYLSDAARIQKLTPDFGQCVVFTSDSHNETNTVGKTWTALYDTWLTLIDGVLPDVPIVAIAQNPENGATWQTAHARRCQELVQYAAANSRGVIDVYDAFVASGEAIGDLLADTVHPNAAGSLIWKNLVKRSIDMARP